MRHLTKEQWVEFYHIQKKIIHPGTDQIVPIGETGELCTRGYCVMLGYWNDPKQKKLLTPLDGCIVVI
jgi:acyl-CoA synthetase (AMP-forming)/AMP-acid ligase II